MIKLVQVSQNIIIYTCIKERSPNNVEVEENRNTFKLSYFQYNTCETRLVYSSVILFERKNLLSVRKLNIQSPLCKHVLLPVTCENGVHNFHSFLF